MKQARWMIVGVLVVGLLAREASAILWDRSAGTNDWHTATNWDSDTVPTSTDDALIGNASSSANHVLISSAAACNTLQTGPRIGTTNHQGYLDIQANVAVTAGFTLHAKGSGWVWHSAGALTCTTFTISGSTTAGTATGTYTLSGTGTVTASGALSGSGGISSKFVQDGASTTAQFANITTGATNASDRYVYELKSGTLTVTGDVESSYCAWYIEQTGGTASVGGNMELGTDYRTNSSGGPMEWYIKGNSALSVTGNAQLGYAYDGSHLGDNGKGQVTLDGSKGTGSDVTVTGNWRQVGDQAGAPTSMGTLKAIIDASAIATASNMRKIAVTGNATFDNGSTLNVAFDSGATPTPGTWTLMTWGGTLTNNGLTLVADAGWSFSTTGSALKVTYIPEPATLALLGLGGLGLLLRRRR